MVNHYVWGERESSDFQVVDSQYNCEHNYINVQIYTAHLKNTTYYFTVIIVISITQLRH